MNFSVNLLSMKRLFIIALLAVAAAVPLSAQDVLFEDEKTAEPGVAQDEVLTGTMTVNHLTGRIAINGVDVDPRLVYRYFSSEEEALFNRGNSLEEISGYIIGAGVGTALGTFIGTLIAGGDLRRGVPAYIASGVVALVGLPIYFIGRGKINKAVSSFNTSHGYAYYSPELTIGVQDAGVGLAFRF